MPIFPIIIGFEATNQGHVIEKSTIQGHNRQKELM